MTARALVLIADCTASVEAVLALHEGVGGPVTKGSRAFSVACDQASGFVAGLRSACATARIAVHAARPDAIGFSHAARLLAMTPPGHTLLTVAGSVGFSARSLGRHRLVGTLRRVELFSLAEAAIVPTVRLPEPPAVAVAREPDLLALEELLSFGIRTLTIGGRPGVGKTHLMVRLAHRLKRASRQPVFLDLTGHTRFGALAALGRELGIPIDGRLGGDRIVGRLAAGIEGSGHDVVMLDHVPAAALSVLARLIQKTSVVWILCGPRPVGVGSEVTYHLHPIRSSTGNEPDASVLFGRRAPHLGTQGQALAAELSGHPLAIELAAGWVVDRHPMVVFEWLASHPRSLADVAQVAFLALPDDLRARLLRLCVWPDALGVRADDPDVEALLQRGWLRVESNLAVPGLPSIRLHPLLRALVLERNVAPADAVSELYTWMAAQCEAMSRMLYGEREASVFDVVSAWVPTLDALLTQILQSHPLSSADLARVAPVLELRVACGTRLGSVDRVLEGLEKALQGAGARFDLDPVVVIRLFQARGEAFLHRREWERAEADLSRAETLADRRKEGAYQARLAWLLARVAFETQDYTRAEERLATARTHVPDDAPWRGAIPTLQAMVFAAKGRTEEAMALLDLASEWAANGATSLQARIYTERAVLERRRGQVDRASAAYEAAVVAWGAAGRPEMESTTMFQLALLRHGQGRLDEASSLLEEVERRARASGEDARRGLVVVQRALIQLERGLPETAQGLLIEALSAARLGGDRAGQGAARGFMALSHQLAGEPARARDGYRSALQDLESGRDRRFGALFHCLLGAAEAELGNHGEARILLDMARLRLPDADPAMRQAIGVFELVLDVAIAEGLRAQGEESEATAALARVHEALDALVDPRDNIYLRFARRYLDDLVKDSA